MLDEEIRAAAIAQAAEDVGCGLDDLTSSVSRVISPVPQAGEKGKEAVLRAVSFGSNVVVCCMPSMAKDLQALLGRLRRPWEMFEPGFRERIEGLLAGTGARIETEGVSFLPDQASMAHFHDPGTCVVRVLEDRELTAVDSSMFPNVLDAASRSLDRLAVGAFDPNLVGLAVASEASGSMWNIRVDVPNGRQDRSMAVMLLHMLASEVLAKGKVPCLTQSLEDPSGVRNALLSGLRPFQATLEATCGAA